MINLPAKVQSSINFFQFDYYRKISKKWSDPSTSPKCYWTLLKTLLLNFYWTLLKTPPLQNSVSLIDNGSTLLSPFPLIPEKSLSDVDFSVEDIKNITSKLDSNKAHGDDMISICMLKLCDISICKPLGIIFKSGLTQGIFPSEWKKNAVRIHKKNDKQCVTNYGPVSLLPICSKGLERIIYNTMFTYFIENNLISENQ